MQVSTPRNDHVALKTASPCLRMPRSRFDHPLSETFIMRIPASGPEALHAGRTVR